MEFKIIRSKTYGREDEFNYVQNIVLNQNSSQNINLFGVAQIGISSFLDLFISRLQSSGPGQQEVKIFQYSLRKLPNPSPRFFWGALLCLLKEEDLVISIGKYLERETYELSGEIEQILRKMPLNIRIIFVIDDFDYFADYATTQDLNLMLNLVEKVNTAFVVGSKKPLAEMNFQVKTSAISNFSQRFHSFRLKMLSLENTFVMINGILQEFGQSMNFDDLMIAYSYTGGHPLLIKQFCKKYLHLGDSKQNNESLHSIFGNLIFDSKVSFLCKELFSINEPMEQRTLKMVAEIGALELNVENQLSDSISALERYELVHRTKENNRVELFSKTFKHWIRFNKLQIREDNLSKFGSADLGTSLKLNEHSQTLFIGKDEYKLSRLQVKLIKFLLKNVNRPCSKQELLENVWPDGRNISVVEKGINRLRVLLEDDPLIPSLIVTVQGQGYMLKTTK